MWAFVRYSMIGGAATAAHYGLLIVLIEVLNAPAAPAAVLGAMCGAAVAYAGNRRFTFRATAVRHGQAVPRFLFVTAFGAAMNGLIVWLGTAGLSLHYLLAQLRSCSQPSPFSWSLIS